MLLAIGVLAIDGFVIVFILVFMIGVISGFSEISIVIMVIIGFLFVVLEFLEFK